MQQTIAARPIFKNSIPEDSDQEQDMSPTIELIAALSIFFGGPLAVYCLIRLSTRWAL